MKTLSIIEKRESIEVGNWAGAKELFPKIDVNQETAEVTVTYLECDCGKYPNRRIGETTRHEFEISVDGDQMFVRGETTMRITSAGKEREIKIFAMLCLSAIQDIYMYIELPRRKAGWKQKPKQ